VKNLYFSAPPLPIAIGIRVKNGARILIVRKEMQSKNILNLET